MTTDDHQGGELPSPNPDNEQVRQIENAVAERVAELTQAVGKPEAEPPPALTSKFIRECLASNELGDGLLYAAKHRGRYVFAKRFGVWYRWAGHSWLHDELDESLAVVEDVVDLLREEYANVAKEISETLAKGEDDPLAASRRGELRKIQEDITARIKRLRTERGRQNCLKFAASNRWPLAITGEEFDMVPHLLSCANGVINLFTGQLEPGSPEDYLSRRSPVEWKGIDEPAPLWEQTLKEIYADQTDLIEYMQRLYGMGCSGFTTEHVFPVLHGRGRNGKSLILKCIRFILGSYAGPVPSEMLLESTGKTTANTPDPAILALKGLRIAIASETDDGRRFSSAKVKWLTGGDELTGRGIHDKKPSTFLPTHLLVLMTNHKPVAPETDFAFWERCCLIPHTMSYVSREPTKPTEKRDDKTLFKRLWQERAGILAWLVRGFIEWDRRKSLEPPRSVIAATSEYRDDENFIGQFLAAATVKDETSKVQSSDLYNAFVHWYQAHVNPKAMYTPAQKKFGSSIVATEEYPRIKKSGAYAYHGLRLTDAYVDIVARGEISKNRTIGG